MRRRIWSKMGAGEMKGRKSGGALRRAKWGLAFGVLLCAGLVASGAFGMVADITGSTDSTATDTTATSDTSPASSTGAETTTPSVSGSTTQADTTTPSAPTSTEPTTTTPPPVPSAPPSIVSDAGVYGPGATVTLSGAGWLPAEHVHLFVNDDQGQTWS